jgi:hypothetical protein
MKITDYSKVAEDEDPPKTGPNVPAVANLLRPGPLGSEA